MNYGTQVVIAYHMFLDYLKSVFGSGVIFPTEHLAPPFQMGYTK
jgi:hypothetical protein